MDWMRADRPLAQSALVAIAIGVLGDAYLPLGLASSLAFSRLALLWPAAAAVGLAIIVAIAFRTIVPGSGSARWVAAAVLLPLLAVIAVLCCLPPIARDELTHHLAIPELYVQAKRIVQVPFADQSYYPMLVEMFYTPMLAWLPDNTPKLIHLFFGLAAAAVIGIGVARESGPRAGLLAVVLTLATPVVMAIIATAYVDLALVLYTAIALLALLRWFETEAVGWFVVSALSAGFACSSKYNGSVVLLLLAFGTALAPTKRGLPKAVAAGAAYLFLGLLPWAPWLIKNWWETGNPMFPLFHNIFGGRALPDRPSIDIFTRRLLIHGDSWLDIALIPFRIFLTGHEGSPAQFDGVLNPIFFVGIAAAAMRSAKREHRLLLGFAAAYFAIAFFQTDMRVRYILPILPALVLITAPAVVRLHERRRYIAVAALAVAALFSTSHLVDHWNDVAPLEYLSGRESRDTYVSRFVPELPVLEYANRHLPPGGVVYLAFLGSRSYYCRRPFTYDTYFSGITLRDDVEAAGNASQLLARLRADGITHMIAMDTLLNRYLLDTLDPAELRRWQAFARAHLSRIDSQNGVSLYRIG